MKTLLLCSVLLTASVHATDAMTTTAQRFVPKGWKLHSYKVGDLNQDNRADLVVIAEQNDPAKRIKNEDLGTQELNLNPRRLLILLQTDTGYQTAQSIDGFLPSANDADSTCLQDPLEVGGISIAKGVLNIEKHYWQSCGSWEVSHDTYRFRHENGRFRLIGFDSWSMMRNSGERSEESVNYLTGKKKIVSGLNEFKPGKPKVKWETISSGQTYFLDDTNLPGNNR